MLKEPIIQAKEMAGKQNAPELLSLFVDIFGIDEQVKEEVQKRSTKTKAMVKGVMKSTASRVD